MSSTTKVRIINPSANAEPPTQSRVREARRELLGRITEFVMKHDLNVTGLNLAAIGSALSGTNAALAKAFVAREISGDPIDQRWLDTVVRLDPESGERMNELETLMDKMESSLMRFAQSAQSAVDTTSEQRGALGEQIEALVQSQPEDATTNEVDRIIELSQAMLERIGEVETAMERSQAESAELRASLAEARIEADVDHLTKLPNRRAFERRLMSCAEQSVEKDMPLTVAFCDVDHFKSINDTHGHDAGDRVLQAIAALFKRHSSAHYFVARHGGEEFVMLFYGLDKDTAWRKLDGMRREQAAKMLINRETGKSFGKITFSAGIAEVVGIDDTREALRRADEALYRAKSEGRNRVVTGNDPTPGA
ncbi:MAG: diguanylate cyclase [Pseudomonadota bacterium]